MAMSQTLLLLLVLALVGAYSVRLLARVAPLTSELPFKALLATVAAAAGAVLELTGQSLEPPLMYAIVALAVLAIAGPLVLVMLARGKRYRLALTLTGLLYWTPAGRAATRRLLAQVALQQGEAAWALELVGEEPEGVLVRAQALALQERWDEVLALELPEGGDNAHLGRGARIAALIALGELARARDEIAAMEAHWQQGGQGPIGYRSLMLAKARLSAAQGDFEGAHAHLQDPLPGVPPYQLLATLAEAAERSGRDQIAVQLYTQAYALAPVSQRERFKAALQRYDAPLPEVREAPRRSTATLVMVAFLAVAYMLQLWIDQQFGVAFRLPASSGVAAFLLNIPGVPEGEALWRYLSYAFVHGNLIHIGFNAWVLFDIGRMFEARRNWGNMLAAFTVGTAMGAYFTTMAQAGDQVVLVGASGGVLGVAGALLADAWRSRSPNDRMLTRALFQWIVLIMLISLLPGISLWGHVGGLVGGLLWGFVRQGLPASASFDRAVGTLSVAALAWAALMAGQWLVRYLL
jgi:membrane associated rhomboid family serine protease